MGNQEELRRRANSIESMPLAPIAQIDEAGIRSMLEDLSFHYELYLGFLDPNGDRYPRQDSGVMTRKELSIQEQTTISMLQQFLSKFGQDEAASRIVRIATENYFSKHP